MTTSPYQLSGCSHAFALAVVQKHEWKSLGWQKLLDQAAPSVDGMSWQKKLTTPPAKGKGGKWYIRFPSKGSLINRHARPCVVSQQ